ncbi:MAG TPA: NAD(P)-dependent oxidoreductase [Sphaerochaeta sp.]|nr:NAD(P)-dependent oxidoreductase [Sphaerochaeta sp.]
MKKKIGFIGLGHMGLPMALNLCKEGYPLYVCSRNNRSQQRILEAGGIAIESFKKMGSECDVIISIVPADQEVIDLYTGEDGILSEPKDNLVCIEMTSARGSTKEGIANYIQEMEINAHFIDAPVSGGVKGATEGTLSIMVGCEKEVFEEHLPILEAMGSFIVHTGAVGTASHIKMLNQMLNAANTAIAAEVLCLARDLGIDDTVLSQVINKSSGRSFVFEQNVPKYMMSGDHTPGFMLKLMKKDVSLFTGTAREKSAFAPLANLVYQIFEATANAGFSENNYTAIHSWYEQNQRTSE